MGSLQSSNSRDYKQQLGYYPHFDSRPIGDQDYKIVEQKHLGKILNGEFSDLFEDEDVEHVWIYHCPLRNAEGAKIGAAVLGPVAGAAVPLCFVPGINVVAIPVAATTGIAAGLSGGTAPFLNHQFVLIRTKKWLYVVAKGKGGCECFRAPHNLEDHLLATQKQYDQATRSLQANPNPKVWKHDKGKGRLFGMIRWMDREKVIEKTYNWAGENCKNLAKSLFNLLAESVRC